MNLIYLIICVLCLCCLNFHTRLVRLESRGNYYNKGYNRKNNDGGVGHEK
jgi:hypothetical protein